jgi:Flp pilus assembly protein TadB
MRAHGFTFKPRWAHLAIVLAALAAHGVILRFASIHFALSATAMAALLVVLVLKHVGLLGAVFSWARNRGKTQ